MVELLSRMRGVFFPSRTPLSPPAYKPPVGRESPTVEREASPSAFRRLPPELLLHIISFLPGESAVAVSLVSRYHYATLKQHTVCALDDGTAKKRFLRLLEVDLPEYLACHHCDILYRWKKRAGLYACPRHYDVGMSFRHRYGLKYCPEHPPFNLPLETVAAFLRGYERGPAYGPQLDELQHQCEGSSYCHLLTKNISRSTEGRMVKGKLVLRTVYRLRVSLREPLAPEVEKFRNIGCRDSYETLPALIMDAITVTAKMLLLKHQDAPTTLIAHTVRPIYVFKF